MTSISKTRSAVTAVATQDFGLCRTELKPLSVRSGPGVAASLFAAFAVAEGSPAVLAAIAPMTVKQFAAFMLVAFHERPHTVTSLAESLSTTPPVITRTLDRLEGLRLVSRARSSADRRVVQLALTRKGQELAALIDQVLASALGQIGHATQAA